MTDFVDGQELIFRKTRDPLLLMDESGDILDASAGACALLGYDREELVNLSLFDLYQRPTIRKERQETFRPVLQEGTGNFEAWIRNNDGQDFPARIAAQSLEVEGGTLILALMQDISGEVEEESVLRREAEWLRGALADIDEAMLILDPDGTVRMVNRDAADLAGLTQEELEGQLGWTVFANHELEQAIHELFQSCMKGEEAEGREVVLEMAEEPLRMALSARSLLREEKLDGCMIRLRNITREAAVLKDLEESCELYRNLVEGAPEGIYLVDREGAFIYANGHLREMLGRNREDLVLGSILDFIEPEQMDILKGYFRSRVAGLYAPPLRIDLRLEDKLVPVEMDCSLLEVEGEITGILGVVRDLTWRADLDMESHDCQTARDLIYSMARVFVAVDDFESCMGESLRVMVGLLGGDAGALYGYDADRDHLDMLADTGLDESAKEFLQEKSLILREGCVGQILRRGESLQLAGEEMEGELQEELLAVRRQHVAAFPFGNGEKLNGLAVIYSSEGGGLPDNRDLYTALGDIFHISLNRAHLLDNLAEVCEKEALVDMELREAERIKDEFVSLVDEKLRAPVQRLRSFIENLERGWSHFSPAAIDDYFLQLRWEMTDLERIIDRLLLLSAQESGHLKLEVSPFEVTNLLEKVAQIFVSRSVEHEIELELPPYMLIIEADQALMESVLMSLMDNAIRFSPQGGTVRLSLNEKDRDVVILVKDEGLGFTDDEKQHLFEKFQKPLRREKEELTGLGLGLYLSRTVVELHGGRIDLISRPDEGSTFFVVLPKRRR
jgi:PAS domain S-box-containing protein